jgi:Ca-activated chloride channel homolog
MIVFDASGSMAGNVGQGIGTTIPRIDEARHALAEVLSSATTFRRVGLITFGPGPYQQCNVTSISSQRRTQRTPSCAR